MVNQLPDPPPITMESEEEVVRKANSLISNINEASAESSISNIEQAINEAPKLSPIRKGSDKEGSRTVF
jgi:hypothetical protein